MNRYLARLSLVLAALLAGVLNGSPLAAPVLIFMVYLVAVLVRQGRAAVTLIEEERLRLAQARTDKLVLDMTVEYEAMCMDLTIGKILAEGTR